MTDWNELHKRMELKEAHERLVSFAKDYLKPGMRLLDLGCGKGRHSLYCAKKGMEVHAIDIADNALEPLRKEVEKDQLFERIKVQKADIRELPYPDGYFNAIIAVNVINHGLWEDIKDYFAEAERVLKEDGLFFIIGLPIEFIKDERGPNTKELERGTFVGLDVPDGDLPHHGFSHEEIEELLSGFDILKEEKFEEFSKWIKKDVHHIEIIARKK